MTTIGNTGFSENQLFEIAKIISNDYNSARKTFKTKSFPGYVWLTTDVCDWAPLIRVYAVNGQIFSITVNGDYTDGWQEITNNSWQRVEKYLQAASSNKGGAE